MCNGHETKSMGFLTPLGYGNSQFWSVDPTDGRILWTEPESVPLYVKRAAHKLAHAPRNLS